MITVLLGVLTLGPAQVQGASVLVRWTAPGDDGKVGRAARYDLRYSRSPITTSNFLQAYAVPGLPAPALPGTPEIFTVTGLVPATIYYFAIKTADERNNWSAISNILQRNSSGTVDVPASAVGLQFSQPWPNPASRSTRFALALPEQGQALIEAFDLTGRRVRTLISGVQPAGERQLVWDLSDDGGRRLAAGVYLVRAQLGATRFVRRVVITS